MKETLRIKKTMTVTSTDADDLDRRNKKIYIGKNAALRTCNIEHQLFKVRKRSHADRYGCGYSILSEKLHT